MKNKKGFVIPLIIAIVAIFAIGGGYYYAQKNGITTTPESNSVIKKEIIATTTQNNIVGGDKDIHGCIGSAGYSWCEIKNKCLRVWEEKCEVVSSSSVKTSCIPNWTCGWGVCSNGYQEMVPTDSNNCTSSLTSTIDMVCPTLARKCVLNATSSIIKLGLISEAKVCSYLTESKSQYACPECSASDEGEFWNVSTHCSGTDNFPIGQSYILKVNKIDGKIEIVGVSN